MNIKLQGSRKGGKAKNSLGTTTLIGRFSALVSFKHSAKAAAGYPAFYEDEGDSNSQKSITLCGCEAIVHSVIQYAGLLALAKLCYVNAIDNSIQIKTEYLRYIVGVIL